MILQRRTAVTKYRVDGSYAALGSLQGELVPFTGKTKQDAYPNCDIAEWLLEK